MKSRLFLALALSLALAAPAFAVEEGSPKSQVLTESFLAYHPDVKFRMQGIRALDDGLNEAAFSAFVQAARYADKASQAMVAEMYWSGIGTPTDRALAYAWMDLASERGYRTFVVSRERYWKRLDAAERERALREGEAIYAEYGDDVAKERLTRTLDKGRRQATGSRLGFVGALTVMVPGPTGAWVRLDGNTYYADHYWKPKEYFEWQDEVWSRPPQGVVDVGPLESARQQGATPPED